MTRRTWARAAVASFLALVPLVVTGRALADSSGGTSGGGTPPSLGGWNVTGSGSVVDVVFDNSTGLAGIHPVDEAEFPAAQSDYGSGQVGSALATIFWPGNAGGDFGSLSGELGIPPQLQPIASQLNDPVRAAVQYSGSGDAKSATYPTGSSGGMAEMHATAGPDGTTSTAALANQGAPGVLAFSAAKGASSALADSTARATATSDLTGVSVLGGLIDISSLASSADAKSDGHTGSGSAGTHVGGITVLGQKASIGSDGLVLPDFAASLGPVTGPIVQDAVSQTISALGMTVTEFPSSQGPQQSGAGFTATSGGVAIRIQPPPSAASLLEQVGGELAPLFPSQAAIIPTLPGILQGGSLTITLGRATASASASPSFSDTFNPNGGPSGTTGEGGGQVGASPFAGAAGTGTAPVVSTSPTSSVGTGTGTVGTSPPATGASTAAPGSTEGNGATAPSDTGVPAAVSLSSPLGAGAVALALLVASGLGYALLRVARLLQPRQAGPACPLDPQNLRPTGEIP